MAFSSPNKTPQKIFDPKAKYDVKML